MVITMLSTHAGSRNGLAVEVSEAGTEHDFSATRGERDLAAVFVREGWAVASGAKKAVASVEAPAAPDAALPQAVEEPAPRPRGRPRSSQSPKP